VEREILPGDWLEKRCRVELVEKGKFQIKRWIPTQRGSIATLTTKPAAALRPPLVRKFPDALERLQAAGRVAGLRETGCLFR
jgi:hypothetical protein